VALLGFWGCGFRFRPLWSCYCGHLRPRPLGFAQRNTGNQLTVLGRMVKANLDLLGIDSQMLGNELDDVIT
jgi:hypothetical protein